MFAVIYQAYLLPESEEKYQECWSTVASYFVKERGAIGSCLHRSPDNCWVAYSRWPDRATRDAAWPGESAPSESLPEEIRKAIEGIKSCIDPERKIPDIYLDVVNDLLI